MPPLLSTARKDLLRLGRDPIALLLWVVLPLVVGLLMIQVSGGQRGPAPKLHLLVADEDASFLSRLLVNSLALSRAEDFIRTEKVERLTGQHRLARGEGSALLVIPKGFAGALLREQPTRLTLLTNPAQRILPAMAEQLLRSFCEAVFYLHRLIGSDLHEIGSAPLRELDLARLSRTLQQAVQTLGPSLFPPLLQLESEPLAQPKDRPAATFSFTTALFPGLVLMALLFAAQGLSGDLWREREAGVLRRVAITPLGLPAFLTGKLLAAAVVQAGVALVVLAAGMAYLSLPRARLPLALGWALGAGLLLTLLMQGLQMQASSRRGAWFLTSSLIFPLFLAGGGLFPSEVMPGWMAAVGRWTPNGWATEQLKGLLLGRPGPLPLAVAFGLLAGLSGGLWAWNAVHLAKSFSRK